VTITNPRPDLNESQTGASGITKTASFSQVFKNLKSDPVSNSYEVPVRKSLGRPYLAFYDHEDTFHRLENAPPVVEHIHPLDAPVAAATPPKEEKIAIKTQNGSIPACNSHSFPGCVKNSDTASPWKSGRDLFPVPESTNNGDKVWAKVLADEKKAEEKAKAEKKKREEK